MALTLDLLPGEKLEIGGCVTVMVVRKAGRCARIEVSAPASMPIVREPPLPMQEQPNGGLPVSFRLCANLHRKEGHRQTA